MKNFEDTTLAEFGKFFKRNIIINPDKRSLWFISKDQSTIFTDEIEPIDNLIQMLQGWRRDLENTTKRR
jgi:hypothetical protein